MKTATTKKPVYSGSIDLPYTKGIITLFCKTTYKLFCIIMAALAKLAGKAEASGKAAADLVSCIWVVNHTDNKLEGLCSVSSSVCDNKLCSWRQKIKDCICSHCYAQNQQSYKTGLKEHNILNGLVLRNILIPVSFFKKNLFICSKILRIESFGDVANVTQARNYIRIIKAFPRKRCAIWSKNLLILEEAFRLEGKPKNTTFVFSSSFINKPAAIDRKRFSFVDHRFTVFDADYIKRWNIKINCGGKKCMNCIKAKTNCYYHNDIFDIFEQLK